MSLDDRLRQPLAEVLECARRIAELSIALLNGNGFYTDELRRLDLPHLIAKAMTVLRGYDSFAPDLKYELDWVQRDASKMLKWAKRSANELKMLSEASGTDPDAAQRYGQTSAEMFQQAETYRQRIFKSCNRAYDVAGRIGSAALEQEKARQAEGSRELPPNSAPGGTDGCEEGKRKRIPKEEANILVRGWLLANAKDNPFAVTRDGIAAETGVSKGMVSNCPAWKAFQAERNAKKKPVAREVPLTDRILAAMPADCPRPDQIARLNELAAETKAQQDEIASENRHYKPRHNRRHEPS